MNPSTDAPHERSRTAEPDDSHRFAIEEVLARAGVSRRLARECESRGLIEHTGHGYTHEHIRVLRFARRACALGFGMSDIAKLLALRQDVHRRNCEVKYIALSRSEELESRIEELQATKLVLERLAGLCLGDRQPDCPILDELMELEGFASQWSGTSS